MAIVSVDTNVIIRLLTKDDNSQFQLSLKLFQEQNIFICDTVILEVEWVLRFAYKFSPSQINKALQNLFALPNVHLTNANVIAGVLNWHQLGLDFADAFHLAQSQQCSRFYTFDRQFLRKGKELSKCKLKLPKF